jgi:hypothetical protein
VPRNRCGGSQGKRTRQHARAKATGQHAAPPTKGKGRRVGPARGGHTEGQLLPTLPRPPGRRHSAVSPNTSPNTLPLGCDKPPPMQATQREPLENKLHPCANTHQLQLHLPLRLTDTRHMRGESQQQAWPRNGGRRGAGRGQHKRERGVRQGTKDCESSCLQGVLHEPPLTSWCRRPLPGPQHTSRHPTGGRGSKSKPQLSGNPPSTPPAGEQVRRQSGEAHARANATRQYATPPHKGKGRRVGQARGGHTNRGR